MTATSCSPPAAALGPRRRVWLLVLGAALLVRAAALLFIGPPSGDPDRYWALAERLAATGQFGFWDASTDPPAVRPTAFRPPLYPLVLAPLARIAEDPGLPVGVLHVLLGAATTAGVFWLATRWQLGAARWLATLLVLLDPILLNQMSSVMTETLAAALVTASLVALTCWHERRGGTTAALAGVTLALTVLCRPSFLPWAALCGLGVAWQSVRERRIVPLAACAGAAALLLLPWGWRNQAVLGQLRLSTTHGGYTLLLGNNPSFYAHLRESGGAVWDAGPLAAAWDRRGSTTGAADPRWNDLNAVARLPLPAAAPRDELRDDRLAYQLAKRYVRREPGTFLRSCAVRFGRFWQLVPHPLSAREGTAQRLARWAVGAWYAAVYLLVAWSLIGRGAKGSSPDAPPSSPPRRGRDLLRTPWLWGALLVVVLSAVHTLYWSNMRMRAPVMPFLSLVAALPLAPLGRAS